MVINVIIGLDKRDDNKKLRTREAVRGVILKENKLLMVKSNKGDYKLPGGGIKVNEGHNEALVREVLEETGYNVIEIIEPLGKAFERHIDTFEENAIFEMISNYYLCKVSDIIGKQQLDKYEEEQEFTPVWVSIDEAINNNEKLINKEIKENNHWIHREVCVLKILKKYFEDRKGV